MSTSRPWIIGKAALSLDGRMTRPPGEGPWITSEEARCDARLLRAEVDAVLVGAETARRDNPRLTVRDIPAARQPWRIVVSRSGNLPPGLHLFTDEFRDRTLVLPGPGWPEVLASLPGRGIRRVLVEGGGNVLDALAAAGLVDEAVLYYAPFNLVGGGLVTAEVFRALPLLDPVTTAIGPDLKIRGRVRSRPGNPP